MPKVLFVGESWSTLSFHLKGFSIYTAGEYEEGGTPLIDGLSAQGIEVDYLRSHEVASRYPKSVEALAGYDVVVYSDVGADTFLLRPDTLRRSIITNNPLADVCRFVEQGGGFLMVGGYLSFSGFGGNACYPNTALADILPVDMLRGDDRIERPEGVSPRVATRHEVLDGIDDGWPPFLGYQKLIARSGATTVLEAGEDPFLVLGSHGAGRTAAFASDCSPHWGTPQFVDWGHYARFWAQLVRWLAGGRS
jgi:uncharacterized membrane protein